MSNQHKDYGTVHPGTLHAPQPNPLTHPKAAAAAAEPATPATVRIRCIVAEAWHSGTAKGEYTDGRMHEDDEADVSREDADALIAAGQCELASEPRRPKKKPNA